MRKTALSIVFLSASLLCWTHTAWALLDLSVSPRRGGQSLRFEEMQAGGLMRNEEVEVAVETDQGAPYNLFLDLQQPLTNEFGNTLPQGSLFVFSPSGSIGTLRTALETPLAMGRTHIYASNGAGDSDSFILVFNVRVPEGQTGGTYRSQLSFTVESSQGGFSPRTVTLELQLEIRPAFRVEVKNVRGGRELNLGRITQDNVRAGDILTVEVTSNIAGSYRVIQEMNEPLMSVEGLVLEGDFKYRSPQGEAPLETGSVLLFAQNDGQSASFQVQYEYGGDVQQAGVYLGQLNFRIESDSPLAPRQAIAVPVRLEIDAIFNLDIEVKEGLGLHFGSLKPGENQQARQVNLTVHSNLRQSYQISQILSRKLSTGEGTPLPEESFSYFGQPTATGRISSSSPAKVPEGESVVFISDNKGTPEKVSLSYLLSIPPTAKAGVYNSEIKYSITTL